MSNSRRVHIKETKQEEIVRVAEKPNKFKIKK